MGFGNENLVDFVSMGWQTEFFERSEELAAEKAMEWMRQGVLLRIQRSTGISSERMKE
jgi:hypothetical protein